MEKRNNKNCTIRFFLVAISLIVVAISLLGGYQVKEAFAFNFIDNSKNILKDQIPLSEVRDRAIPTSLYTDEGYNNFQDWWDQVLSQRKNYEGYVASEGKGLEDYFTTEDKDRLNTYQSEILLATSLKEINNYQNKIDEIIDQAKQKKAEEEARIKAEAEKKAKEKQQQASKGNTGSSNFKSQGVVYQNGKRYTYYSSRVLRHYRTNEWHTDSAGFYHDNDGYFIVASDEYSKGSVVSTPWGSGKVYDCGAGSNTIDMYTNF